MNQIEKVARAMCRADPEVRMGDADGVVEQRVNIEWVHYVDQAKAAIAAMPVQAEPVAWRYTRADGHFFLAPNRCRAGYPGADGWTETPLYAHPPAPQWQGIESAPRDGTDLIVAYTHIATVCVFNAFYANPSDGWDADDEGWWTYTYSEVSRVKLDGWQTPTHWMPLPTPPAGGSDAE